MGGNCKHNAFYIDGTHRDDAGKAGVGICNDEDGYYLTVYESWEEVEAFIAEMRTAAVRAFGAKS